ncbi:MAG: Gfo/Idh/MocA family oxidoreductase [Bryobacteraceae bacterium]
MQSEGTNQTRATRRGFLLAAAASGRVLGANDRIQVAVIGVGGNGTGMLRHLLDRQKDTGDIRVAAVCDVYNRHKERARDLAGLEAKDVVHDYRDLLARTDIDCVVISVPDHWHAPMAIDAISAGKDVYLQKPMTLTTDEAKKVSAAAARHGRMLQVGSQHLSDKRYQRAKELIEAGEIGDLLWAQATYSRNSIDGEWNYYVDEEASPATIDWKRWLGSAPQRPFSAERYFRWRKYWDYSGGIATDLFYHKLGPLLYAMGPKFPARVSATGGIYVQRDREVPDTYATLIEYPKFFVNLSSSMANAAANQHFGETIYGSKGTISFGQREVIVAAERTWESTMPADRRGERRLEVDPGALVPAHMGNLLDAMRTRKPPVLNAHFGYQIMTAIKLGVDSYREGRQKHFDAIAEREVSEAGRRPAYEGDGKNRPGGRRKRT